MEPNSNYGNTVAAVEKPANYKRVNDDDLFRHSSQYRLWSFTPEQLEQKRIYTNAQTVSAVEEMLLKFRDDNLTDMTEEEIKNLQEKAVPVTEEEELKLVDFYAKKVLGIAQHMNLPTEVIATSLIFFRRFYLENSVMEIDPKTIVHTTIFLACKSENYFISVDSFAKKTKATKEAILKYEFKILESLKFSLLNHHPYRPLHGFFLDIQSILNGKVDVKYMGQIYERCKKRITDALLTDVVFLYTPPQITLATLLLEDEALTVKYLETKFAPIKVETKTKEREENTVKKETEPKSDESVMKEEAKEKLAQDAKVVDPDAIDFDKLMKLIAACKEKLQRVPQILMDDAKSIAAKVYFCSHPNSSFQRTKRQQENKVDEAAEKKQKV